ncbi:DinB family protein [Deinococcus altitudinis]|uniref:DinB family protein n=1 Tax=Deinococcus altitudinis TaxID=468914 RepID=UPI003892859A
MTQAPPERARGTRMLTAFGETQEQIQAELHKAFARFTAAVPDHQDHWLTSPAEGRWSPAQVTEHVMLVNENVGRIVSLLLSDRALPAGAAVPGETVGGKRVAPAGLEPGEGLPWDALEPRWQASWAVLDGVAARLEGADLTRRYFHPFLGEIDAHDWTRMVTFHLRHHCRQLAEGQPAGAEAVRPARGEA